VEGDVKVIAGQVDDGGNARGTETIEVCAKSSNLGHMPAGAKPGERRGGSMKTLLAFVALAICIAAPAFAQPTRKGHTHVRASRQEQSSIVHPYAADHHYPHPQYDYNNNANPDFQLGGSDR
jgi:hypothetical protein